MSKVALCGIGASQVEGQDPDFAEHGAVAAKCFLENRWNDYPQNKPLRAAARLDPNVDFVALGRVAEAMRAVSPEMLKKVTVPVMVLVGGADGGAPDEYDLSPFIPGAKRVIAGKGTIFRPPAIRCSRPNWSDSFSTRRVRPPSCSSVDAGAHVPRGFPAALTDSRGGEGAGEVIVAMAAIVAIP